MEKYLIYTVRKTVKITLCEAGSYMHLLIIPRITDTELA